MLLQQCISLYYSDSHSCKHIVCNVLQIIIPPVLSASEKELFPLFPLAWLILPAGLCAWWRVSAGVHHSKTLLWNLNRGRVEHNRLANRLKYSSIHTRELPSLGLILRRSKGTAGSPAPVLSSSVLGNAVGIKERHSHTMLYTHKNPSAAIVLKAGPV